MNHYLADTLDDAADYIENRGWIQGEVVDEHGHVCAVGAVELGANRHGDSDEWLPLRDHALLHLGDGLGLPLAAWGDDPGDAVAIWNDHPERTQQEVLDALRAAAKSARE